MIEMQKKAQGILSRLSEIDESDRLEWLANILTDTASEGWHHRDDEKGTYYEIGWEDPSADDAQEDGWYVSQTTTSKSHASHTAYRWGCEYRSVRTNPFER
jgi:hypothetical protein